MSTWGRGALGGAVAAWVTMVACGDPAPHPARADAALQRDLRLAAAATVALAGGDADASARAARFLPAADEAPRTATVRRSARPTRRAIVRVPAAAPVAPAAPAVLAMAVPSAEPATERMQRYAGEEGASSVPVGVVLRGGAVGDDHCERELPRARPAQATLGYRATTVRLGGVPSGPRPAGAPPFAAPF